MGPWFPVFWQREARLSSSFLVVPNHWEPPPISRGDPEGEDSWNRQPVAGTGDIARVVVHNAYESVWLDPVFDKQAPRIQVVSAGQVARQRLLGWWCNLIGHRPVEVLVLEGSPVDERVPGEEMGTLMAVVLELTDGRLQEYALEPVSRMACRTCRGVDRHQVDRGPGMARLRPTGEQIGYVESPVPQQVAGPLWLRMWLPWNPWGPFRGFYISILAPAGMLATSLLVSLHQLGWVPRAERWLELPALAIAVDMVFSNMFGYLREFLKTCGARFDQAEPFGQRPGNSRLWEKRPTLSAHDHSQKALRVPTTPNVPEGHSSTRPE